MTSTMASKTMLTFLHAHSCTCIFTQEIMNTHIETKGRYVLIFSKISFLIDGCTLSTCREKEDRKGCSYALKMHAPTHTIAMFALSS